MKTFAALLTSLIYTRSRNAKLDLIDAYSKATPDPDRGWALAALIGNIDFPAVKAATVRAHITERVDPVLFQLSRDYVGDTAETVSLLWPDSSSQADTPTLGEVVHDLQSVTRATAGIILAGLLDRMDADARFATLKFATGGMHIGVSERLAKLAFAKAFGVDVNDVEAVWHALQPPYTALFAWSAEGGASPDVSAFPCFRPFMLTPPLMTWKSISRSLRSSGNGMVSAYRLRMWAARHGYSAAAGTTSRLLFPTSPMLLPWQAYLMVNCWYAAVFRAVKKVEPTVSMHCSNGWGVNGVSANARRISCICPAI